MGVKCTKEFGGLINCIKMHLKMKCKLTVTQNLNDTKLKNFKPRVSTFKFQVKYFEFEMTKQGACG